MCEPLYKICLTHADAQAGVHKPQPGCREGALKESKEREKKPDPYSVILLASLVGAIGGGAWLGLALAVLSGPARSLFDLAAAILFFSLLAAVAYVLTDHRGAKALRLFCALTLFSALISYLTH